LNPGKIGLRTFGILIRSEEEGIVLQRKPL
jgi:hypothetical protein